MKHSILHIVLAGLPLLGVSAQTHAAATNPGAEADLERLREAIAKEHREVVKLRSTTEALLGLFVEQGLLDRAKAEALLHAAEAQGAETAGRDATVPAGAPRPDADRKAGTPRPVPGESVHVAYVPDFIKDEIRQQVRSELKDEVVREVKADAREERWGVPAGLPDWLDRFTFAGDLRLRVSEDFFGEDNALPGNRVVDYLAVNRDRGHLPAIALNEEFLNTTEDRVRVRERLRLALEAAVTDHVKAGIRVSTTNQTSPVSVNQTLGNTGQSWDFVVDQAFLQYDHKNSQGQEIVSLYGGRIANPWMSTDLLFDRDLSFEGFAGTFRLPFSQNDSAVRDYRAPRPTARTGINTGAHTPNTIFATAGVFPIEEVNFSTSDKWLIGGQVGLDWLPQRDGRFKLAGSYYGYENINARPNARNSAKYDWTAPEFIQKGNSIVPITVNDGFNSRCTSVQSAFGQGCLYGLASEFQILNLTALYDYAGFGDVHVMLTADVATNLGYDSDEIARDFGGLDNYADNTARTDAFQIRLDVGLPEIIAFKDWNAFFAYRYLERDSVLDAFTDSVFHAGGTNTRGWMLGGNYGIARNTWLNFLWLSADNIDGPPLLVDTALLDLNVRF